MKIINRLLDRLAKPRIDQWQAGYEAATRSRIELAVPKIPAPHPPAGALPLLGDLGDTEQDVQLTINGDGGVLTVGKIIAVDKAGWIKLRGLGGTNWINSAHVVRIEVSR